MSLVLSRARLRSTTGNQDADVEYLNAYADACVQKVRAAAANIGALADGQAEFDAHTAGALESWLLAVRFYRVALEEGRDTYEYKPHLARIFTDALERSPTWDDVRRQARELLCMLSEIRRVDTVRDA